MKDRILPFPAASARSLPIRILLALSLAASIVVITPGVARAHDSCAIAQPAASGVLGAVLNAVNVYEPVVDTSIAECGDKYEDVVAKPQRDWVAEAGVVDPSTGLPALTDGGGPAQTFAPCTDGTAADTFPCDSVDLLSHVEIAELGGGQTDFRLNDMWGWTDPETGDDFALVGTTIGTAFVNISDPMAPVVYGMMPTASTVGGDSWRDLKVFDDHVFVVSEHDNHGVQVFDLTRLRDFDGTYQTYGSDARYIEHGSAHNININTDTGIAYSVGAGPYLPTYTVTVDSGTDTVEYPAAGASFGTPPTIDPLTGDIVLVDDGSVAVPGDPDGTGTTTDACQPLPSFPDGALALVDRGACGFTVKAENVQNAGATAMIVANNVPGDPPFTMGGTLDAVTISSVMISFEDGVATKSSLPTTGSVFASEQGEPPVCGSGLHMIDVNDPTNPQFAGCDDSTGYVHDTQCVIYDGPDADHTGKEICFNSNGLNYSPDPEDNFVSIVDVTDKANPITLSRLPYEGSGYSHQGWLTEDQTYFLHGDEGDEQINGVNTTTRVWDVADLDAPQVVNTFVNDTTSIDHNLYTEGRYAYASNYTTGLRVYDSGAVSEGGSLADIGFFDVYPENDNATFEGGTWSNYPYFAQEDVVAVSSIDRGLFVLRPNLPAEPGPDPTPTPTPTPTPEPTTDPDPDPTPGPGPDPTPDPGPDPTPDPGPGDPPDAFGADDVTRLAGGTRIETAIEVSQDLFPEDGSADAIVLARADIPFDALAATPLSRYENAPMLLTESAALNPLALDEVVRAAGEDATVYLLGGTAALSESVRDDLADAGVEVERLAGPTRVETALAVADHIGEPDATLVASANNFPDALTAGAAAAAADGLVLLSPEGTAHPAVQTYIDARPNTPTYAVGGPVGGAFPDATSIVGSGREATAVLVAEAFFDDSPSAVGLARSNEFADALTGGAHAAIRGGPVLLTPSDSLDSDVSAYVCDKDVPGYVYGGSEAITDQVADAFGASLEGTGCTG